MLLQQFIAALLFSALLFVSHGAAAQTDKAAAEALFREGMRLTKAGTFAEACPKFEESQRLEPSLGAQYYLADCYEKIGRTASAWANFAEVANRARVAKEPAKEKAASDRAAALEPRLSRLTVEVADRSVTGLLVQRKEIAVGPGEWGVPVPVDPGTFVLRASAPGRKPWSKTVEVAAGASVREVIPPLEEAPVEAPVEAPAPSPVPPLAVREEPPAPPPPSHTQRTVGLVVGVTGFVALGAGGILGVMAKSADSDSKREGGCSPDNGCSPSGLDDRNRALHLADTATAVSIVGAAMAVTGSILWLTAPKSGSRESAELGVGPGSLFVRRAF